MANLKRYVLFLYFTACSVAVFSASDTFGEKASYVKANEETMTIVVKINSDSYTRMKDIPTVGYFDVYTILGERIKRLDLKKCKDGVDLELTKGLYILRAGKVTQKIVVR